MMTLMSETPEPDADMAVSILRPPASLDRYFAIRRHAFALPGILIRALMPRPVRDHDPAPVTYRLYGDPSRGAQILAGWDPDNKESAPLMGRLGRNSAGQDVGINDIGGFFWLDDLLSIRTNAAIRLTQHVIAVWIREHENRSGQAWQSTRIAHRLIAWIRAAPLLLFDAPDRLRSDFARSIAHHAVLLNCCRLLPGSGLTPIAVRTALILARVFLKRPDAVSSGTQDRFAGTFRRWLQRAALQPDTNPQDVLRAGFLLSLVIETCRHLNAAITPALSTVAHDVAGLLAAMRLTNAELCRLAHGGLTPTGLLSGTLATLGVHAPSSGSVNSAACTSMMTGGIHAVMNTRGSQNAAGRVDPTALSLELAVDDEILLMDSGDAGGFTDKLADWVRAEHGCSAVHLARTPSFTGDNQPVPSAGIMYGTISRSCQETLHALHRTASHNGYQNTCQATIERTLALARDGACIEGLDTITINAEAEDNPVFVRISFNIHPMVEIVDDESALSEVRLRLPSGKLWQFALTDGRACAIADTIFVNDLDHEIWKTSRLLVHETLTSRQSHLAWSFARVPD